MKIKGFEGNYDGDCDECPVQECFDKLAEYEKTGITPGQIREMSKMYEELATELGRYKKAEEQGLLLKLPCKVGDAAYFIFMDCPSDYKKEYCRDHQGSCENCPHRTGSIIRSDFRISDIPNMDKIYTTWAEAEKALKEMEG